MGNQISRNVISIVYFLFYVGSAPNLLARNTIVLLFFFFYGLVIAMKSNKKFDAVILIPLLLFAVINFLSILKWGGFSMEFLSNYVGYNLRYLTAYFFLKYVITNFFSFYDRLIYTLALISIPFWLVQLFDVSFFHDYLGFMNLDGDGDQRNRWHFLLYTAYPSWVNDGALRNSGFTSEPSFFGFLLLLWICLRLMRNRIKMDREIWIVMSVGLTTLSTTYFISLVMVFMFIVLNNRKVIYKILSVLGGIVFLYSFYVLPFGMQKIDMIWNNAKEKELSDYDYLSKGENISRVPNMLIAKDNIVKWPLGHGLNENGLLKTRSGVTIKGSGSFTNNCIYWGVSFFIFFPIVIWRFWYTLKHDLSMASRMLLLVMTCAWLFSSIELKDPLFFMIICIGLMRYVPVSVPVCKNGRVGLAHLRYTDSILDRFRERQLLKSIANRKRIADETL